MIHPRYCSVEFKVNSDGVTELGVVPRKKDPYGGGRPAFTFYLTLEELRKMVQSAERAIELAAKVVPTKEAASETRKEIERIFRSARKPGGVISGPGRD